MSSKYEKYYKVLDLDVGASKEKVKKSFRELSHIWHPDNHAGKSPEVQNRCNEKFKELSNAYEVLSKYLEEQDSEIVEKKRREEEQFRKKAEKDKRDQEEQNRGNAEKIRREEEQARKKAVKLRKYIEELNRINAEKIRREEEKKERKQWEELAKKKHEEEKNKGITFFFDCPECNEEIKIRTTVKLSKEKKYHSVICESCTFVLFYYFEDGEPIVFDADASHQTNSIDDNSNYSEKNETNSIDDNSSYSEKYEKGSLFSLIRLFSSIAITFLALMVLFLFFSIFFK
jgi:curved DNA-binding protein CbpA